MGGKHEISILDAAEDVVSILKQHRIDAIVIGAVACLMFVWRHLRSSGISPRFRTLV